MKTSFAGVVDEVRELSFEERQKLIEVLEQSLIAELREEILDSGEKGRHAFDNGELSVYSDADDLMRSLNGLSQRCVKGMTLDRHRREVD